MKGPLSDILENLTKLNEILAQARYQYLLKESERKHFEANLVKAQEGKSHAEKTINAQSQDSWLEFHRGLARMEAVYEFRKLQFSILERDFQARYLELKLNEGLIGKQDT